jgi:hypothetical protein
MLFATQPYVVFYGPRVLCLTLGRPVSPLYMRRQRRRAVVVSIGAFRGPGSLSADCQAINMYYILYPLSWAMTFASGTSCLMLYKGKFEPTELPHFLQGEFGRRYAYPLLFVVWFSAVALLFFGFSNLKWYWVLLELLAGLITSAILQTLLGNARFVMIGPPVLVALQAALWTIRW